MNCSFVGFRTPLADVERSPRVCVCVCSVFYPRHRLAPQQLPRFQSRDPCVVGAARKRAAARWAGPP